LALVSRRLALLVSFGIGGALFGAAVSRIPSPSDPAIFWIGNYSAPWAMLPFLSGRFQRSWTWAAAAGIVADVACVAGFYAAFLTADPGRLGLSGESTEATLVATGLVRWVAFIGPWLVLATVTGFVYGMLGCWWGRSRSIVSVAAAVAPFVAEPVAWWLYRGSSPARCRCGSSSSWPARQSSPGW
jgi:hypothetical protein